MKLQFLLGSLLVGMAAAGKGSSPDVEGAMERVRPCGEGEYVVFGCEWEANGSPSDSKSRRTRHLKRRNLKKEPKSLDGWTKVSEEDESHRKLIGTVTPEAINCILSWKGQDYLFEDIVFPDGWALFRSEAETSVAAGDEIVKKDVVDYFRYIYSFDIDLGDEGTVAASIDLELEFDGGLEVAQFDDEDVGVSCPAKSEE